MLPIQDQPNLGPLLAAQLASEPQHERYFQRRFSDIDPTEAAFLEEIAGYITVVAGTDIGQFIKDYGWLCQMQVEEELYFRRNNRYRLTTLQQAIDDVYSNKEFMTRYMNGLLMTQLWWSNHTAVLRYYRDHYLPSVKQNARHLEIGPGHGLQVFLAAEQPRIAEAVTWDLSPASIALTEECLAKLKPRIHVQCILENMFAPKAATAFDSIVFSEVLEHMEKPGDALQLLSNLLTPDGRVFINMPINSAAPDHLFNTGTPEELFDYIGSHGLKVVETALYPATGNSLERARRKRLTINCVAICGKA